ncbi:MAG: two-component system cell cycle response regulator DivK [Myxococcota bacterium]
MAYCVLIVEDNEMNMDLATRRLKRMGFRVISARNGEEAVAVVSETPPDAILMDMGLPIVDGWEATRRLKANAATRGILVIAVTAHAMSGDREKALQAGCDEYETKPVNFTALGEKIHRLLGSAAWAA